LVDHVALTRVLRAYASTLLDDYEIGTVLFRLTDEVVAVLGADGAGVSLTHNGHDLSFVTATDADITAIEEEQVSTGQGPCHEAFRQGRATAVEDLARTDPRWPDFRRGALSLGARAILGLPMPAHGRRIGALDIYRRDPHRWTEEEIQVGQLLADTAAGYVLNAIRLSNTRTLADQLQHALDSRVVIEQAKGVLSERHKLDPDEAFRRLRAHARSSRIRIQQVGRAVVNGDLDLPEAAPPLSDDDAASAAHP
jgi:GAF domain-containing protein